MRIVVTGTHASGKSTLISDFAQRHPDFVVLPDPFEMLDAAHDAPSAAMFSAQLRVSADRLRDDSLPRDVIAERGPLDFLAYLLALAELSSHTLDASVRERAVVRTVEALSGVDVLVVLPLTGRDAIHVGEDEDLPLRATMNDILLELVDDPDLVGPHLLVSEITGTPAERLAALEALLG